MLWFWPVLGAFLGLAGSRKNGFSAVGGVLVGILLGPLAVLMFAIGGRDISPHAEARARHAAKAAQKAKAAAIKAATSSIAPTGEVH